MRVAALLFLFACSTPPAQDPAASAPAPDAAPAPAEAPVADALVSTVPTAAVASSAMALPDVGANLSKGQCANGPGNEGADSYFVGNFKYSGNNISGEEKWVLFANPKWVARGGKDCTLKWTITGTKTSDWGSCQGCTSGVSFHAEPVLSSDCPEELVIGRKLDDGRRAGGEGVAFDQKYGLKETGGGRVQVYFAKSGKLLGEGYIDGSGFNYVSNHSCRWF